MNSPIFSPTSAAGPQIDPLELQHLQHLAELGRLSATLLHEINNPLTAVLLHLESIDDQLHPSIKQARRSVKLLRSYVEAARQQVKRESTLTDFKLRPAVNQVKKVVLPLAKSQGVQLMMAPLPDCRLYGDPVKFQQILANLIVNAIEAYNGDSHQLIKPVKIVIKPRAHWLTIEVRDWGKGISPQEISRIFEPFYSTKRQPGQGLGIGLSVVHQYVTQDFGGHIMVRSSGRSGTTFTIRLPALYRPMQR